MNDNLEQPKVTQNTEYAGPPKAHDFQNNTNVTPVKADSTQESIEKSKAQTSKGAQPQQQSLESQKETASENSQEKSTENSENIDFQDNELLELISRPDRNNQAKQAAKKSFSFEFKSLLAYRKKIRDYIKDHKSIFTVFNLSWILAKTVFYFVGLSFFILCLTLYLSADFLINDYLDKHALSNISIGNVERSLEKVILTNIHDNKGLFKIARIKIDFSLADLFKRKISMVTVDSLGVYLTSSEDQATSSNFQDFIRIFWQLGILDSNSLFSIQSIRLENSFLYVDNKEYKLPVNFSGIGSLAQKKQITLPVSLETKLLKLNGNLTLAISSSSAVWTFDILSGKVNIPGFATETLKGQLVSKTSHGKILSVKFLGGLTSNGKEKVLDIELTPTGKGLFNLSSNTVFKKNNTNALIVALNLSNIKFDKNLLSFSTNSPLFLKLSNLKTEKMTIDSMLFSSTGNLTCNANGCSYAITEKADLVVFMPTYKVLDTTLSTIHPLRLSLEPAKDSFSIGGNRFSFNLGTKNVDFRIKKQRGTKDPSDSSILLTNFNSSGYYDFENRNFEFAIKSKIQEIENNAFTLSDGNLEASFKDSSYKANIQASNLQLTQTPYFKLPFQIDMALDSDDSFTATINTADKWISLDANGYFYPTLGEVHAAVRTTKPIAFGKDTPQPAEVSSLFSPQLKKVSGKLSFKGEVRYTNTHSISGPMQVLLDDISFDYGNIQVKKLNSLMNLTQIVPFGTKPNQEVYVQSVLATVPFNNISAQVFFDPSKKQFNVASMNLDLAGYPLSIDPIWYTYNLPVYSISLRGKTVPIQPILDNMTLKDLTIIGNGYLNITSYLEEEKFTIKNAELLFPSSGLVQYTPKKYASKNLETLKNLNFRRLSAYLTEQNGKFDLLVSADNKRNKIRKKTTFRFNLDDNLSKYFLPLTAEPLPDSLVRAKEDF